MKTSIKRVVKLFRINPRFLSKREDWNRWVNVIVELSDYDYLELKARFDQIVKREGTEKPKLYYMEGVRREVRIARDNRMKREPACSVMRQLLPQFVT